MRVYIWEDVLSDYSSGMVVIVASTPKKAKEALHREFPPSGRSARTDKKSLALDGVRPKVYTEATAPKTASIHFVYGGG